MISRSLLVFAASIAITVALCLTILVNVQQQSPYSQHAIGGAFAMTEMTGRPVTDKDLRGKPTAIAFGFTYCPEVCPTTLLMLSDVMKRMGPAADKLNVVFATIDPGRDTPEEMKLYLSSFDPRIRGFTGTDPQVAAMANAYHIYYHREPTEGGGYTMDHTAGVFLFDKAGQLVGELPSDERRDKANAKLTTLVAPDARLPGAPPRVDLWNGAALGTCGAS